MANNREYFFPDFGSNLRNPVVRMVRGLHPEEENHKKLELN